jgi:hypothetical protein
MVAPPPIRRTDRLRRRRINHLAYVRNRPGKSPRLTWKPSPATRSKGVPMGAENTGKKSLKQKVAHEFEEMAILTCLSHLFLLRPRHLQHGSAQSLSHLLFHLWCRDPERPRHREGYSHWRSNARRYEIPKFERKALFYSALWKAFMFAWLVFGFLLLEEIIKGKIHRETVGAVFHDIRIEDLLVRTGVVFITFIPLSSASARDRQRKLSDYLFSIHRQLLTLNSLVPTKAAFAFLHKKRSIAQTIAPGALRTRNGCNAILGCRIPGEADEAHRRHEADPSGRFERAEARGRCRLLASSAPSARLW